MKKSYKTKAKKHAKVSVGQIKKRSICFGCKYGHFYQSDVVWFECAYPEWKCTEDNQPIMVNTKSCEYRELGE